jgi:hypothetical protein
MRAYPLVLTAALLAGCGIRENTGETAANEAPPAPAVRSDAIPAPFLGVYDGSLEACTRPSDERLAVTPRRLRFHESIGTVRIVTAKGPDAIEVEADYQGEGESWRSVRELRLSGGGTLTVSGDGTRLVRVRCPERAR